MSLEANQDVEVILLDDDGPNPPADAPATARPHVLDVGMPVRREGETDADYLERVCACVRRMQSCAKAQRSWKQQREAEGSIWKTLAFALLRVLIVMLGQTISHFVLIELAYPLLIRPGQAMPADVRRILRLLLEVSDQKLTELDTAFRARHPVYGGPLHPRRKRTRVEVSDACSALDSAFAAQVPRIPNVATREALVRSAWHYTTMTQLSLGLPDDPDPLIDLEDAVTACAFANLIRARDNTFEGMTVEEVGIAEFFQGGAH